MYDPKEASTVFSVYAKSMQVQDEEEKEKAKEKYTYGVQVPMVGLKLGEAKRTGDIVETQMMLTQRDPKTGLPKYKLKDYVAPDRKPYDPRRLKDFLSKRYGRSAEERVELAPQPKGIEYSDPNLRPGGPGKFDPEAFQRRLQSGRKYSQLPTPAYLSPVEESMQKGIFLEERSKIYRENLPDIQKRQIASRLAEYGNVEGGGRTGEAVMSGSGYSTHPSHTGRMDKAFWNVPSEADAPIVKPRPRSNVQTDILTFQSGEPYSPEALIRNGRPIEAPIKPRPRSNVQTDILTFGKSGEPYSPEVLTEKKARPTPSHSESPFITHIGPHAEHGGRQRAFDTSYGEEFIQPKMKELYGGKDVSGFKEEFISTMEKPSSVAQPFESISAAGSASEYGSFDELIKARNLLEKGGDEYSVLSNQINKYYGAGGDTYEGAKEAFNAANKAKSDISGIVTGVTDAGEDVAMAATEKTASDSIPGLSEGIAVKSTFDIWSESAGKSTGEEKIAETAEVGADLASSYAIASGNPYAMGAGILYKGGKAALDYLS